MMRNTPNLKFRHTLANHNVYEQPTETDAENMEFGYSLSKTQFLCPIFGM
jgi:hypothetical protein